MDKDSDAILREPPVAGDELDTLLGALERERRYVAWKAGRLHGRPPQPPWDTIDWDADPDWEWRTAAEDSPEQLMAQWQAAVDRSRTLVAEAIAGGGLGRLASSERTLNDCARYRHPRSDYARATEHHPREPGLVG